MTTEDQVRGQAEADVASSPDGPLGGAPPVEQTAPTRESQRISSLDVYRGVALCGILLLNIAGFALPGDKMTHPLSYGSDGWPDKLAWFANTLLFDGTFRGSFSILFGAGVILLTSRIERDGRSAADIHYRRNIWLIAFGVIHAYVLLWPGDILYRYGIASLFLYPFRRMRPRALIIIAVLCMIPPSARDAFAYFGVVADDQTIAEAQQKLEAGEEISDEAQELIDRRRGWYAREVDQEAMDEYIETMRDGYLGPFMAQFKANQVRHTKSLYKWDLWDALSFMFLGMALFKTGVLSAARSRRFYITLAIVGYAVGLSIRSWTTWVMASTHVDYLWVEMIWVVYDPPRVGMTLGHMSLVMLLCQSSVLGWLKTALAAAGRMALTNYIGQTIIACFLFFGFGLGWFGELSRAMLLPIVVAIWVFQLITSVLWLRWFRFGPLEWLWRSLTYVKLQPMRR